MFSGFSLLTWVNGFPSSSHHPGGAPGPESPLTRALLAVTFPSYPVPAIPLPRVYLLTFVSSPLKDDMCLDASRPALPVGDRRDFLLEAAELRVGRRRFASWRRAWTSLLTHRLPTPWTAPPGLCLGAGWGWGRGEQ